MNNEKIVREPLFHVTKRTEISVKRQILARVIAFFTGLLICCIICAICYKEKGNPWIVIRSLFEGSFGTERKRWLLLQNTALLLGVGCALIPAFKMKFWNLGGNGQVLIGALVTIACMRNYGGRMPDAVVWLIMLVSAVLCGALWAAIPAVFKAFFKTNESLFTLMMNYIASGLVVYFIKEWSGPFASGSLATVKVAHLPRIGGNDFLLIIIVAALMCAAMFVYMKYTKHGFEASVVGESENTARYIGINVKKTIIRTLALSGALCGLIGFLIAGAMDHTVSSETAQNLGFTAIIAVWIAKMNPLCAIASSFGIIFMTQGMAELQTVVQVSDSSVANMIVGIMYFCIIGCEFFVYYALNIRKKKVLSGDVAENDKAEKVETENAAENSGAENLKEDGGEAKKEDEKC